MSRISAKLQAVIGGNLFSAPLYLHHTNSEVEAYEFGKQFI